MKDIILVDGKQSISADKTLLSFFGGVGEIGGNKILLHDKDVNVFLDFGKNFEKENQFYENPYITPREEKHLLELNMLPKVAGLYRCDETNCDLDAIFITHPHTDHYYDIRFIKDCYPIYCGEATCNIMKAMENSGHLYSVDYNISKKNFKTYMTGDIIKNFDPIIVTPVHVEHSVPGSYGLIIETANGNIVYTGDLRMQGSNKSLTEDFIKKAQITDPDILIIEGTNIDYSKIETEEEVKYKIDKVVSKTKGLILAGFNRTDIDRLRSFYNVAITQGRILVLSMKQAYLVHKLKDDSHLDTFNVNDPNVRVFVRNKKTIAAYEKEIASEYDVIDAQDVNKMQNKVIMVASLYDMNEMADIKPVANSVYILSTSEPFDEVGEFKLDKLKNWLNHYGIPIFNIHASGHADAHELREIIERINPKRIIPIHTARPELFQKFVADIGKVELPVNLSDKI